MSSHSLPEKPAALKGSRRGFPRHGTTLLPLVFLPAQTPRSRFSRCKARLCGCTAARKQEGRRCRTQQCWYSTDLSLFRSHTAFIRTAQPLGASSPLFHQTQHNCFINSNINVKKIHVILIYVCDRCLLGGRTTAQDHVLTRHKPYHTALPRLRSGGSRPRFVPRRIVRRTPIRAQPSEPHHSPATATALSARRPALAAVRSTQRREWPRESSAWRSDLSGAGRERTCGVVGVLAGGTRCAVGLACER